LEEVKGVVVAVVVVAAKFTSIVATTTEFRPELNRN
jgi:hypothetical protein